MGRRRRRLDPFNRRAMLLSIGLHATLFILGWASTMYEPPQIDFITYEIELVSPPPTRRAEVAEVATEELVIERPEPEPAPPEPPAEEVVPIERPRPEPDPPPPTPEKPREVPPETAEETRTAATPTAEPEREEAESGEGLNVRIEGLRRDYPEYYNNIILQIRRCLRWGEGGSWQTTVFFNIDREGLTRDVEFVTRSGNVNYDFQVMGAIECAGRGRFGPLPADLPYERFPVRFTITSGGEDTLLPDFGSWPGSGAGAAWPGG